jgi:hypothetical protein
MERGEHGVEAEFELRKVEPKAKGSRCIAPRTRHKVTTRPRQLLRSAHHSEKQPEREPPKECVRTDAAFVLALDDIWGDNWCLLVSISPAPPIRVARARQIRCPAPAARGAVMGLAFVDIDDVERKLQKRSAHTHRSAHHAAGEAAGSVCRRRLGNRPRCQGMPSSGRPAT